MEQGSTEALSIDIGEEMVLANNNSQKIHGYALAELLLEFSPLMKNFHVE